MERQKTSLNQLAGKARVSPAFLSRILNKERGLPSDKVILRLAEVVDLQPPERLLIEAGRIPEELKTVLSQSRIPALLRAAGELSETDQEEVLKTMEALVLKQRHRKMKTRERNSSLIITLQCLGKIWEPAGAAFQAQQDLGVHSLEETTGALEGAGYEISHVDLPGKVSGFATIIADSPYVVLNRAKCQGELEFTLPAVMAQAS